MDNINYNIYKLPENNEINISKKQINIFFPSLNNRDLRLLKNDIKSDISYLVFKDNIILIKFDYIAVILFQQHAYFIKFLGDSNSNKFIHYIKQEWHTQLKIEHNPLSFKIFIFELILNYLSDITDDFLEKSFQRYSMLSINTFRSRQLSELLTFQHSVLLEKNKNQEYYESLLELVGCVKNLEFFQQKTEQQDNKEKDNICQIINSYLNRVKEDIKNLDRLNREVNTFIQLINVRLAEKRNQYALKSLNLEIFSCTYSLSCFFVFMFGTNLKSYAEDVSYGFYLVIALTIILHIPVILILKRVFNPNGNC